MPTRNTLLIAVLTTLVSGRTDLPLQADPLPQVRKDQPRGSLDGYDVLRTWPELHFPDTVPSPVEIDWRLGPDMPLPVKGGVAGVLNNHLVIVPGIGVREHDAVVQALDLKTMQWTGLPRIPKAPVYTTGVTLRDSIVVLSGRGGGKGTPEVGPAVQRLRFRDGRWRWDELPPLPGKIWYGSSAAIDDRWIAVSGGDVGRGEQPDQVSRDIWLLDMEHPDRGWQTVAQSEQGLLGPTLAGLHGKLYVCGGAVYSPTLRQLGKQYNPKRMGLWHNGYIRRSTVHELDLSSRKWRRCPDMPYPRASGVGRVYRDRYVLIFGGSSHSRDHMSVRPGRSKVGPNDPALLDHWLGWHDEVFLYDPARDRWSVLDRPMPYGSNDAQATIDGDVVYVTGGEPAHWYNANTEDVVMIGAIRVPERLLPAAPASAVAR